MQKSVTFIIRQLNPLVYLLAIHSVTSIVISRWGLLWEMSKRDIHDRYAGQWLGSLWAIIYPVFIISLYIFVFAYVFAIRAPSAKGTNEFTLYLLSGLLSWMSFQEILGRSPSAIINETSMVKQVVFPVEVIPLKAIFSAVLTQTIATALLVSFIFYKNATLPKTLILWPLLVVIQIVAMMGISLLFSAVTPFIRDLKDIVQVTAQAIMYTTPIFYSIEMVPKWAKPVVLANPITHMVLCYQDVLYYGSIQHPWSWLFFILFSAILLGLGARFFVMLKNFFGNVL